MIRRLVVLCAVLLAVPLVALAALQEPLPDTVTTLATAITVLTPVLTGFALWGLKWVWNRVPAAAVLALAPFIGIAVDLGFNWVAGHPPANPVMGALLGALATYLREFVTTLDTKGITGRVTKTEGMI